MKSSDLRQKFLDFFEKKGHKIIPSASLIPENDPTVLFTTAGMHPLVPFLLGEKHPSGKRLASTQKCIRTVDINEVGDDTHNTFFEMLGNWSLGDYWKEDAIKWSYEFLTKELKISPERLAISCFAGDDDAPKDEESAKIWESLGIKKERIAFLPKEDNWWGPAGQTGPCGPDTEMFYWKLNDKSAPKNFNAEDENWVEIWNNVFMQYVKDENGNYNEAKQKNVDTGMGLERTIAILNGKENVYETDLFLPIIEEIEKLSRKKYSSEGKNYAIAEFLHSPNDWKDGPSNTSSSDNYNEKLVRIIVDHIKASVFLASEGVVPSNVKQGYILRRLIRRVVRYGKILKMPDGFIASLVKVAVEIYRGVYPELVKKEGMVISIVRQEKEKFEKTLEKGIGEINKLFNSYAGNIKEFSLSSQILFNLYQSYGFPVELSLEEINLKRVSNGGVTIPSNVQNIFVESFNKELEKHQELSRTASAGMFKGGLADESVETTKLHTTAHLMLAGLRKVLGDHVVQKGSNINSERLRFDFSHFEKMTKEQLDDVENFINDIIKKDLPVNFEEMNLEKAKELGAMGVFESKYGEIVKVYTIGSGENIVSREICGGPHVERTGILGHFKIQKEESSSSGVRRIKAILQPKAIF